MPKLFGPQSQLEFHLISGTAELPYRHSLGTRVSPGVNTNTAVVVLKLERATLRNFLETSDSSHLRSQQLGPVVEAYSNIGVVRAQRILPHLNVPKAQTVCLNILALETNVDNAKGEYYREVFFAAEAQKPYNHALLLRHTPTGGWSGPSVFSAICFASTGVFFLQTCTEQRQGTHIAKGSQAYCGGKMLRHRVWLLRIGAQLE